MSKIVSLGSAIQDIYLIDRDDFVASNIGDTSIFGKIEIGTKVDIDKISYEIGGGGTNAATTFARAGHESIYVGAIGNDPAGDAVLSVLDDEGINTQYIKKSRKTTGCSIILLDQKSGERTILSYRGAVDDICNLNPEILQEIQPDWLYISSVRGCIEKLIDFVKVAKSLNIKIMFNPGMLEIKHIDQLLNILPSIDIILVNKFEASKMVPGKVLTELLSHLSNYCQISIITDGSMGGIATDRNQTFRFGLYEDVKVKDTTGAGDAFGSGFLSAKIAGKNFKDSLIFASANSTSVIRCIGSKKGILTGKEKLHQMIIQEVK